MSWIKVRGSKQISYGISSFEYQFHVEPGQEIMDIIKELIKKETSQPIHEIIIRSVKIITCLGCIEDQPNQLAHMDPGGCLYIESDDDDEEESEQKKTKTDE